MSSVIDKPSSSRHSYKRLWRLLAWVALGHVIVILILSPQLYWPGGNSPEAMFERGEQAMKDGKYVEAMELFRKVMDDQPKPPPIYAKAAEQHRQAEKLGKDAAMKAAASAEKAAKIEPPKPTDAPTTRPAVMPAATTQPSKPFIPPELMPR